MNDCCGFPFLELTEGTQQPTDQSPGIWEVPINRITLPRAAERVFFGRGIAESARQVLLQTGYRGPVLLVVDRSLQDRPGFDGWLKNITDDDVSYRGTVWVAGHADHLAILNGIETLHRIGAGFVMSVGGGTALDVGKSVAALSWQEGWDDVPSFQLGHRSVAVERVIPWGAIPTTAGTGAESSDNAVIEFGKEKRSIRGIPPASFILADSALTDSLPVSHTVTAAVDAMVQSLEILTHTDATETVQRIAVHAFTTLAGALTQLAEAIQSDTSKDNVFGSPDGVGRKIRDRLAWGSLLMGLAFAHARLGLPHALVHYCPRFGLAHGHMVGLVAPGALEIQAGADPETAGRLARAKQSLTRAINLPIVSGGSVQELVVWLRDTIRHLFSCAGLPDSIQAAGLTEADLEWIVEHEMKYRPSFGVPARPAAREELVDALHLAFNEEGRF